MSTPRRKIYPGRKKHFLESADMLDFAAKNLTLARTYVQSAGDTLGYGEAATVVQALIASTVELICDVSDAMGRYTAN